MIQNLSNLTKMLPLRFLTMQGAVSIEITEIIWICNVMGFFFKFGKQIISFQLQITKFQLLYL
jgi:hypothetical protein